MQEKLIPKDVADWISEQAKASAAFQVSCADALERQGSALLNLLLAGGAGALAYAVNLAEKGAALWQQGGMAGTALWLFALAGVLLMRGLWSREIYGPANDPANLVKAYDMPLAEAIKHELGNRQFCIEHNRSRNNAVGYWLNLCRGGAAMTPLVFAFSAWAVAAY